MHVGNPFSQNATLPAAHNTHRLTQAFSRSEQIGLCSVGNVCCWGCMQSLIILPPWPGHDLLVEKTTSTSYRGSGHARAPLECSMQQAIVTCTRAAHLMSIIIQELPNAAVLVQVTIACCIGHSNGAHACPDPL